MLARGSVQATVRHVARLASGKRLAGSQRRQWTLKTAQIESFFRHDEGRNAGYDPYHIAIREAGPKASFHADARYWTCRMERGRQNHPDHESHSGIEGTRPKVATVKHAHHEFDLDRPGSIPGRTAKRARAK